MGGWAILCDPGWLTRLPKGDAMLHPDPRLKPQRPRPCQSQIYAEHAREALAEAQATDLPNVRHRFIIAAKRWITLAEQARRMEVREAGAADPKAPGPR